MEVKRLNGATDDLSDAFYVREQVFTIEQGFTLPDADGYDPQAVHLVI